MGAWGVKALDSDDGLDVIEFLTENYLPEHTTLIMEDLISAVKEEGFFGDILALIELYVEWIDTKKLDYDGDDDDDPLVWSKVTDFTASRDALDFCLRYLYHIRNGVPDKDNGRKMEEWEEWIDSDSWGERSNHLDTLTQRLEKDKKK